MFTVWFVWDPETGAGDELESFPTLELTQAYRAEQIEMEGWKDEPGTESDQYVIKET